MTKLQGLIILAAFTCMALTCHAAAPPDRQVAITIDDLPAGTPITCPPLTLLR